MSLYLRDTTSCEQPLPGPCVPFGTQTYVPESFSDRLRIDKLCVFASDVNSYFPGIGFNNRTLLPEHIDVAASEPLTPNSGSTCHWTLPTVESVMQSNVTFSPTTAVTFAGFISMKPLKPTHADFVNFALNFALNFVKPLCYFWFNIASIMEYFLCAIYSASVFK